eukprot:scaffold575931_cov32-Prasinocladus_malaysianus.AAC.1
MISAWTEHIGASAGHRYNRHDADGVGIIFYLARALGTDETAGLVTRAKMELAAIQNVHIT